MSKTYDKVLLAVEANGGEVWQETMCSCDKEVGHTCEYCTIHAALFAALNYIRNAEGLARHCENTKVQDALSMAGVQYLGRLLSS